MQFGKKNEWEIFLLKRNHNYLLFNAMEKVYNSIRPIFHIFEIGNDEYNERRRNHHIHLDEVKRYKGSV